MRRVIIFASLIFLLALPANAGLSHKVGSFQSGTGAATTTVTFDPGFVPKAFRLWTSQQPGITAGDNLSVSYGIATSQNGTSFDNQRSMWAGCIKVDPSVCKSRTNTALVIFVYTGTVSFAIAGSFSATSISGSVVTLTVGTQWAADTLINYEAWGGTDITAWGIATMTVPATASPTAFSDTSLNFQPDFAEFVISNTTTNDTETANAKFGMGFSDGTNSALFAAACSDAAATSVCGSYMRGAASQAEVLANVNPAASVNIRISFTSFDATGLTLSCVERNASPFIFVLAFKGARWHVGTYTAATTATTFDVTDGAWTPVGVVASAALLTAQSTSDTGAAIFRIGFGASDGTSQGTIGFTGADGRTANDRYWNMQSTSLLGLQVTTTSAVSAQDFSFTSFLANGWRGTTVTAAAGQVFGVYYSFAANAATVAPKHKVSIR